MKHIILILWLLATLIELAICGPVTLAWDPHPAPEIAGYELRYGPTPEIMTTSHKVGRVEEATVELANPGKHFFVVHAVNDVGLLSAPSNMVSFEPGVLPSGRMTVVSVSSEQPEINPATHAIDGDPATFWHSEWQSDAPPKAPHEITISLGGPHTVAGFRYLPRQDGHTNGDIRDYEFSVSTDGITWGPPITGRFAPDKSLQRVTFPVPVAATHIRLRGLTDASGLGYIAAAEIEVLLAPSEVVTQPVPPAAPTSLRVVEIQTSANLTDWKTIALVPQQPGEIPAEFVRARITSIPR